MGTLQNQPQVIFWLMWTSPCAHTKWFNYLIWEQNPLEMFFFLPNSCQLLVWLIQPQLSCSRQPAVALSPSQSWGILLGWGWVWYKEQLNYFYSCLCYFFPRAGAHQPQFVVCLLQCLTRIFCLLSHFNLLVPHKKFHSNLYLRNSFSSCDFHVNRIKTKVLNYN